MFNTIKKAMTLISMALTASAALSACSSMPVNNRMLGMSAPQGNPVGIFSLAQTHRKLGLRLDPNRRLVRMAPEDLMPLDMRAGQGLPTKVDLRQWASPVDNQGNLGACTGFSIKAARELMSIRDGKPAYVPLSPLFVYYYERKKEGTIDEDAGSNITTGMNVIQSIGVSPEALWTYDDRNDENPKTKEKFQQPPSAEAYSAARAYRVNDVRALDTLRDIRYELARRNPVVIGLEVYQAFYDTTTGVLPIPNPKEKSQGGHAVLVVGYDDVKKMLIVKNSWGTDWGDHGYFYMPYEYVKLGLASEALTAH